MNAIARQIQLASRPNGWPTLENFRLVEVELPEPAEGQLLVRNVVMSVDPYMRGRMNDVKSYVEPFGLDAPLDGGAIGEVVVSQSPTFAVGDLVLHSSGWRDYALLDAARVRRVDPVLAAPSHYLGALGLTGLTAYAGVVEVAPVRPGETVFVSGAAGAVGSLAGQIAKLRGAERVVGSAGSAAKLTYLESIGYDAQFDYPDGPIRSQLRTAAPDGIDVYFDNVGGDHLEAAISALRPFGRIALCGAIAHYNATEPPAGPRNLALAIGKQLTMRGFLVNSFQHLRDQFTQDMAAWIAAGQIQFHETTVDGIENAPDAFIRLLRGDNIGKMLVRL